MKKVFYIVILLALANVSYANKNVAEPTDREVWTALLYRMAQPILVKVNDIVM